MTFWLAELAAAAVASPSSMLLLEKAGAPSDPLNPPVELHYLGKDPPPALKLPGGRRQDPGRRYFAAGPEYFAAGPSGPGSEIYFTSKCFLD